MRKNVETPTIVEDAINQLIAEFTEFPYLFFTEADAVSRFHQILDQKLGDAQFATSLDGHKISVIHREYPTFFRFSDKNPTERLPSPARRGHYDTVILSPEFIKAHPAETIHNRDIKTQRDMSITPFQAVIEFKLDNLGWSKGSTAGIAAELGKLQLSKRETPLCYFVVLMRYNAPTWTRWEKYWPLAKQAAEKDSETKSVFAVNWLTVRDGHELFRYGDWLT